MAEEQPKSVVEGATADELPAVKSSAEDRKAADALSKLDNNRGDDDQAGTKDMDQDAVNKVTGVGGKAAAPKKEAAKAIKISPSDVSLVMDQLAMTKAQATELIKKEDGDVVRAMSNYLTA